MIIPRGTIFHSTCLGHYDIPYPDTAGTVYIASNDISVNAYPTHRRASSPFHPVLVDTVSAKALGLGSTLVWASAVNNE